MKRNWDLIRRILLKLEEKADPKKSPPKLTDFMPFFADKSAGDDEDDGSEAFLANR
ncbi:DUF4035 domain-containing protein [Chelonobacter oris]|nr:DUF4035 domain-containing protein [Chelonobacter oris]